jgi:hypothetical protein
MQAFATLVPLVLGAVGGWLGAYAKVKGEGRATTELFERRLEELKQSTYAKAKEEARAATEDFDQKLEQLRRNTLAVEEVKRLSEDQTRRLSKAAAYVERQIEEFYGPLFNLVQQVIIANHVQHKIRHGETGKESKLSPAQHADVRRFFQEHYFFPLHHAINGILKSKLYLVEGRRLPESFYLYLRHALQEEAQANLWRELRIDTSYARGEPHPNQFQEDVKEHLDLLMDRHATLTRSLDPDRGAAGSG